MMTGSAIDMIPTKSRDQEPPEQHYLCNLSYIIAIKLATEVELLKYLKLLYVIYHMLQLKFSIYHRHNPQFITIFIADT